MSHFYKEVTVPGSVRLAARKGKGGVKVQRNECFIDIINYLRNNNII